jgi:hypothetical protein
MGEGRAHESEGKLNWETCHVTLGEGDYRTNVICMVELEFSIGAIEGKRG